MIKEDGLFWWADEEIPERHFAPEGAINGVLTISDEGRIDIELHGQLPLEKGKTGFHREEIPEKKMIAGILKGARKYVIAESINRNGSIISTNGISYDRFMAMRCLILNKLPKSVPKVRSIYLSLSGYEEWLGTDRFPAQLGQKKLTITRRPRRQINATSDVGRIRVEHNLETFSQEIDGSKGLFIKESSRLIFSPIKSLHTDDAAQTNELIQDLFVLLTGSDYRSHWPKVFLTNNSTGIMYYFRIHSTQKPPERHKCLTWFADIEENFSKIFFLWLEKSKLYGPGFYLYLSTRKGIKSYTEQRFFSLVSGLETLHRSIYGNRETNTYKDKTERILSAIEDKKDRRWLENALKRFSEPNLQRRLLELFTSLPIKFKENELKSFCARCARTRNSLAHRGHVGPADATEDALIPIFLMSDVMSCLYHLIIMSLIGIDKEVLGDWLSSRFGFLQMRWYLETSKITGKIKDNKN